MNISPAENEIKYIRKALNQFNNENVGEDGHTPLNIVEYDEDGNTDWRYPRRYLLGLDVYRYSLGARKPSS